MAFFNNTPEDWERLDWKILRDGGVALYWRREYLVEETRWLAEHDYDVHEFDCGNWQSRDDMFSDFGRALRLPEDWGRNFDALEECIADIPLTENRGAVLVLTSFNIYFGSTGSVLLPSSRREAEVLLDIIVGASRFHLLNGRRLLTLVQSKDPNIRIGKLGGQTPQWNWREWMDANRQPKSD